MLKLVLDIRHYLEIGLMVLVALVGLRLVERVFHLIKLLDRKKVRVPGLRGWPPVYVQGETFIVSFRYLTPKRYRVPLAFIRETGKLVLLFCIMMNLLWLTDRQDYKEAARQCMVFGGWTIVFWLFIQSPLGAHFLRFFLGKTTEVHLRPDSIRILGGVERHSPIPRADNLELRVELEPHPEEVQAFTINIGYGYDILAVAEISDRQNRTAKRIAMKIKGAEALMGSQKAERIAVDDDED
jgi:hypothetical protein